MVRQKRFFSRKIFLSQLQKLFDKNQLKQISIILNTLNLSTNSSTQLNITKNNLHIYYEDYFFA